MIRDDEEHGVVPIRLGPRALEELAECVVGVLDRVVDGVRIVFVVRLAPFLRLFPDEMRVAVEVRNKALWRRPVLDVLHEQGRALVLIDHPWMDPPERIAARDDLTPAPFSYVRLLGDREAIEKITTKWGETVVDQTARLASWAEWVARTLDEGRDVWVAANNHYAGHGPATIEELERRVREKLGA